jgi:uncharacterized circularly permuted ATP-grasp superfamily protein/uncharacterized alpha-E superfamily protein
MSDPAEPSAAAESGIVAPPASASAPFAECLPAASAMRPHWQPLVSSLERLGREELGARAENSRRVLAEHGVSCFVTRNGDGADEPWQLDLLPLIIGAEDWRELEAGLIQRARLLNVVLGDLYRTQRLVRDGLVPAPLVFANPGYLRACQAIDVKGGAYLQIYAADLARSPDGRWWVLADRTQAPAGLGFALENRSVLSRVLPEAMGEVQPRPVLDTLRVRRDTLRQFAPQRAENPSIVLLTPGPSNEAYFEHTYLARLLGLTLVEGDDLTVRDRRLFVKTLDGLRQADVVLRRVHDAYCDPLELRAESLLGAPGLVEAARAGHVSIGNALGTGLLESPAFMPFLPGLCRHLLDEDLRLPSLATWWCGQAHEQAYVREHLGELVLRPALSLGGPGLTGAKLDPAQRARLLEQIHLRPHEFVAQEQVPLSRAPVWTASRQPDSRPFVLRAFVLHDGNDFTVMPGGLARVVDEDGLCSGALALSGLSKDVWVLPDRAPAGPQAHLVSAPRPVLERAPSDLPSRTADNLFWLGRYTERLEQIVRAARQVLRCLGDAASAPSRRQLGSLHRVMARLELLSQPAPADGTREALQEEILLLLFQEERPGGVRGLLKRIHRAAFSVRDRLSADTWRILNRLDPDARSRPGRLPLVQASGVLHTLVLDLAAFSGMEMENMTRGHGWVFLDLGRRIERGMFLGRLLAAALRSGADLDLLLEPALEIADSVMTHRRRYFSEPRLASALEVLVQDAANPRSLAFQLQSLKNHAAALPTGPNPEGVAALQRRVNELDAQLRSLAEGATSGDTVEISRMAEVLTGFAGGLAELSELLTQVYFSHVRPRVN